MTNNSLPSSTSSATMEATGPAAQLASKKCKLQHDDWVRLPGVSDDLRADLEACGFDQEKVQRLLKQKQRIWDPWRDGPTKEFRLQQTRVVRERSDSVVKRRKMMEKYVPLKLKEGLDWVLYDPSVHGFPSPRGSDPPAIFKKYERFEVGNTRIIEIMPDLNNVRIKSTPKILHNKRIIYEVTGPRIVSIESPKKEATAMEEAAPAAVEKASGTGKEAAGTTTREMPPPEEPRRRPGRPRKTAAPAPELIEVVPKKKSPRGSGKAKKDSPPEQRHPRSSPSASVEATRESPVTRAKARAIQKDSPQSVEEELSDEPTLRQPAVKQEPENSGSDLSSEPDVA